MLDRNLGMGAAERLTSNRTPTAGFGNLAAFRVARLLERCAMLPSLNVIALRLRSTGPHMIVPDPPGFGERMAHRQGEGGADRLVEPIYIQEEGAASIRLPPPHMRGNSIDRSKS